MLEVPHRDGGLVPIVWCDTSSEADHSHMRPLVYPHTDIALLTFAIDNRKSFENVMEKVRIVHTLGLVV